jgi:PKD repeat protein
LSTIGRALLASLVLAATVSANTTTGTTTGPITVVPTTTLTAETSNYTSAASSFAAQPNGNAGASNISKVPTNTMFYPGSNTLVFAHFMGWFGQSNHMNVGYTSSDAAVVQRQVTDAISRGISAFIEDWYGPNNAMPNNTMFALKADAETRGGQFFVAINYDGGALNTCHATTGCDLTQQAIKDLTYAYTNFEQSPGYLRMNGRPVVTFFDPDRYGTLDWALIQQSVPGNPLFIFRNSGGFTHTATSGSFAWITVDTTNALNWAQSYLDNFYSVGLKYPAEHSMGAGYKGFNDTLAAWTKNRIMNQQCGQVWLNSMAETARYYSAASQMESVQLATWNDYEEGSELETGVDNCVTVNASLSGSALNWTIAGGSETTIDHYTVFISTDGQNLMSLGDIAGGTHTLDLSTINLAAGDYTLYVKAVGRPSILNKMSGAVKYTPTVTNLPPVAVLNVTPASGTSPLLVTADASASSDPDGTIAGSSIDFGDGSATAAGPKATHTYSKPGLYTVTAMVTDNGGMSAKATQTVNIANLPPVAKLSVTPTSGVAPVTVTASTAGSSDADGTIASSTINFGDGTAAAGPSASHTYSAAGTYTVTATVYDNLNASSTATQSVTVSASVPPVAKLAVTPTSGTAPLPVTASTAGSSAPNGSIASTRIDFGDGTVATTASASHTYSAAGTYTVRATITDNTGATSSATQSVTASAAPAATVGVAVSSPAAGSSVSSPVHFVATATPPAGRTITSMKIYIDYVSKYSVSGAQIDTSLAMSSGAHHVTVQAWDSAGVVYKNSFTVTVK